MTLEEVYNQAKDLGKESEPLMVYNHNSSQYVSFEVDFTEMDTVDLNIDIEDYS